MPTGVYQRKPVSEETRRKISEAQKGRPRPYAIGNKLRLGLQAWNKGIPCDEETKKKLSLALKGRKPNSGSFKKGRIGPWAGKKRPEISGSKCYAWNGGITPLNKAIRNSLEYKAWRKAVFERDNYTCVWCGGRNGNGKTFTLNADHIKPFALYPNLRFDILNGRTLCTDCHKTTETWGWKTRKEAHVPA